MLLTLDAFEGILALFSAAETVITTSVTHEDPFSPHAFTCRVCDPVPTLIDLSTEVPFTNAVSELLSMEYPIVATDWEEQVAAVAERVNGTPTWPPLEGLLTTTPACSETVRMADSEERSEIFVSILMQRGEGNRIMSMPQREI
jgi:hypothetical protein